MWNPGGVIKVEINNMIHQTAVMRVRMTVMCLNMRTVQRLYGDTYLSS